MEGTSDLKNKKRQRTPKPKEWYVTLLSISSTKAELLDFSVCMYFLIFLAVHEETNFFIFISAYNLAKITNPD